MVERVLERHPSITLEWSLVELGRAVSKRQEAGEISEEEARSLEAFILSDLSKLRREGKLEFIKLTWRLLRGAYSLISPLHLFASDACHLTAALMKKCKVMVVDDYHFERLSGKLTAPIIVSVSQPYERIAELMA